MLIARLRANSGKPFFQYRFNFWQKITLSKNSAIIRCYSEVMTSPFYLVKLESFTLNVCQLELKKGCQPKLLFERFRVISNIVRRLIPAECRMHHQWSKGRPWNASFLPEICHALPRAGLQLYSLAIARRTLLWISSARGRRVQYSHGYTVDKKFCCYL